METREEITKFYLKSDKDLRTCVFEKFLKVSIINCAINPLCLLYSVSLPGVARQCGLKNTILKLQTLQNKELNLLLENNFEGGIPSVRGIRYAKLVEKENILLYRCK